MFGAGTACVVCPVERILYQDEDLHIPTMDTGAELSRKFLDVLTDIQVSALFVSLNSVTPCAGWLLTFVSMTVGLVNRNG